VDAFEKWHHLLEETQHENHCVFRPQEFIVFHDNPCFESTPSLVGIIFVSILITYCLRCQQGKLDVLSRCSYLTPNEGNVAYEQQWMSFSNLNIFNFKCYQ